MVQLSAAVAALLLSWANAQQVGMSKMEEHPTVSFGTCTKAGGCTTEPQQPLVMDAQWRWLHDSQSTNCLQGKGDKWQYEGATCDTTCAMEGISKSDYVTTYGVTEVPHGINLKYVNGQSIGSRLYMMEDESNYKMFKLLNKEFTIDVDVSTLACGLNGAVYFVEMEADGGLGVGSNKAGAKYGTGYCDAQCPHDLKFISGECNSKDWHMTKAGPIGHYGNCCSEMDIWEANAMSTAYTAHPCLTLGPKRCEGDSEPNVCGDTPDSCTCCDKPETCPCCGRYKGVCDRDGCDFNSYRLGNQSFYGKGPQFALDTSKPITVVTQFITSDNTDTGDLVEIRRIYVQNGKEIKNSIASNVAGARGDSLTDEFCRAQKKAFDNHDDFAAKGGLKAMGEALKRGMVLVLSLWDDELTKMQWLDSTTPEDKHASTPGMKRGPCAPSDGSPAQLRAASASATVSYTNIKVGEIGSTFGSAAASSSHAATARPAVALQTVAPVAPLPTVAPAAPLAWQPAVPATAPMASVGQVMPAIAPIAPVARQPVAAAKQAAAPLAVAPSTPANGHIVGQSVCCSSSATADKCGSCWPGSALVAPSYCATQEHCSGCGGRWCPDGVTMMQQKFEEQDGSALLGSPCRSPASIVLACAAASMPLAAALAWLRLRARLAGLDAGEHVALCKEEGDAA